MPHHYFVYWLRFSRRGEIDEKAIQSARSLVPRVGGLAIYIGIVLIPLLSFGFIPLSVVFDFNTEQLTLLILSAAPVFSVGLAEDLGYSMSPKPDWLLRFLAWL